METATAKPLTVMGSPSCTVEQYIEEVRQHSEQFPEYIFTVIADDHNEVFMSSPSNVGRYRGDRVLESFQNGKRLTREFEGGHREVPLAEEEYRGGSVEVLMSFDPDTPNGRLTIGVEHEEQCFSYSPNDDLDFRNVADAMRYGKSQIDYVIDEDPIE